MQERPKRNQAWRKGSVKKTANRDKRVEVFKYGMALFALIILGRLFMLQVVSHGFYEALASGQREIFEELFPSRGDILVHDLKDNTLVPIATNQQLAFIFAEPRIIEEPEEVAAELNTIFRYTDEELEEVVEKLSKENDPYEPLHRNVPDPVLQTVLDLDLPGIHYIREESRLYPEAGVGGHVIGFYGLNQDGDRSGKYGIEGFFEEELAGVQGFIQSERDIAGRIIAIGNHSIERAVDGSDIVLTIDRNIQYKACSSLQDAVKRHRADGGSVVVLEPATGKILAMCGAPDFNPNTYGEAESIQVFNNPAIFNAYEPGSIFKPITAAAALDSNAITPTSTYVDTGELKIDEFTIKNFDEKAYGQQTMTEVLENSLNTGTIHMMRETGQSLFTEYVKAFGFGEYTEIELDTEVRGNITSLDIGPEIYAATASFGQGITTTPIQLAAAFGAIANGGILQTPHIIDEIRQPDGTVERMQTEEIRRVIDTKTARLLGAMMISVIDNGQAKKAGVEGYYIAGKTGTAQVAKENEVGYKEDETIASFIGFGPIEDPRFVILTRIDVPRDNPFASQTAAPLFGEMAEFLVKYLEIAPTRTIH